MLFNSLRSKLTFATSLTASIILGVVITYAVIASKKKAIEAAKIEFHEKAERVTLKLKGTIDNSFSVLKTQNTIFKTLNKNGVLTKSTSIDLIKSNLFANKDYVGMCAIFEPNSLCAKDTSLNNLMDKNLFIPYMYYNSEGDIMVNQLVDYNLEGIGDYYLIPKQTKRPLLTEPYSYPINGEDVLMVTLSEPILQNNEFIGITTIDYDIHFIQNFCQDLAQEVNNGNVNITVISNGGIIVANSANALLIGQNINEISAINEKQLFSGITDEKEKIYFQNGFLILNIPILFSNTETPWRVQVAVPRADIFAETSQQAWVLISIGIVLILLAVTLINILVGNLTRPLFKLVESTKRIAGGDITVEVKTKQNDEVGVLAESFNAMVVRLREIIEELQNSIKQVEIKNTELADKEEKFRKLFEEASDAILLLDETGSIFDCNQSASDYFQLKKEKLLGKNAVDLSPEYQIDTVSSKEKALQLLSKVLQNEPQEFEWEHLNGKGESFTVSISLNKISLSGINYLQAIVRDITEKKQKDKELEMHRNHLEKLVSEKTHDLAKAYEELRATNEELNEKNKIIDSQNQELKSTLQNLKETQSQLLHSEKMASLGILTAGVAHEINNPLNYIMGAYVGLLRHYENNSFSDNYEQIGILINALKIGVERSSAIVQGLNQFSRKSDSLNEDCNIHEIINDSLTILQHQIKHHITIEKKFFHSDILIKGNAGNLHQAFFNILRNAIQSITAEGLISIKTDYIKPNVIIEITDTGTGISPNNLEKVTVPFFTTKNPGEGTGLGLSITFNIIKEHNGQLEFKSELGKGTTVKIVLPKNDDNE
jgi:PAS domain S-box-containing protein